jgi:hypothetical protein
MPLALGFDQLKRFAVCVGYGRPAGLLCSLFGPREHFSVQALTT